MSDFSKIFDHTILKPTVRPQDLQVVCDDAIKYGFCSVAVNTGMVKDCAKFLAGTDVKVDAAVGFPLGITTIEVKLAETLDAIKNGAGEIDYVVNIGKVKNGEFDYVREEMQRITELCHQHNKICKVIFENCYLTDKEKKQLCLIALEVKPDFIKTSTGFGPSSATVEDVKLMKSMVGDAVKVKASGGIRDLATCMAMIQAGADRIGCSNSVAICQEYLQQK